jgi:hypothetical protein
MKAFVLMVATTLVVSSSQGQTTHVEITGGEKIENTFPFNCSTPLFYSADLYLSKEINAEGTISAVAFYQSSGVSDTNGQCKIYLGSIASETLPSTDWSTLTGLSTLVYNGTYCRSKLGWVECFLDKSFPYNGHDNLLVLCESRGISSVVKGSESYFHFTTCKRSATVAATKEPPAELHTEEMTSWILLAFGALPVQLTSFTAEATAAGVALFWRTASETNNYGFFVQAKHSGEADYEDIPDVFIAGHGTTIQENFYSLTIGGFHGLGTIFRLRQVDLDGTVHFSEAVTEIQTDVESVVTGEFILFRNYPNPCNSATKIRYQISDIRDLKLAVYDLLGREVAVLVDEKKEPGSYEVQFDGSGLSSGVYFYRMQVRDHSKGLVPRAESRGFVQTRRLLLLK